jgi:hypothetical protein
MLCVCVDHTVVGRGSPCDVPPPTCSADTPYILLPSLLPLHEVCHPTLNGVQHKSILSQHVETCGAMLQVFGNGTCSEMRVLLSQYGVLCDTNIAGAVPDMLQGGGDGTLSSLCPITCDTCPRQIVDDQDFSSDPQTCSQQNDTCHIEWWWPKDNRRRCQTRRFSTFHAGNATCTANKTCACSPTSCRHEGFECGLAADHCGSTINCGGCTRNQTCYDNRCYPIQPEPEPEPEPEPISTYCAANDHWFEYVPFSLPCASTDPGCLYGTRTGTWIEAKAEAERQERSSGFNASTSVRERATLAIITTRFEQACLDLVAMQIDSTGWLGASDNATEGQWMWIDSSQMTFQSFGRWDPSNVSGNNWLSHSHSDGWRAEPLQANVPGYFMQWKDSRFWQPEPEPEPNAFCSVGHMPTENRSGCIACANITRAFCIESLLPTQPLHAGQPEHAYDSFCVDPACADGFCVSISGVRCERCNEGTGPSPDRSVCETCVSSFSRHGEMCRQCSPGEQPNWLAGGVSCVHCSTLASSFVSSDGTVCLPCLTGQQPNAVRSSCLECGLREYSTDGSVCLLCPAGKLPTADKLQCEFMHVQLILSADIAGWTSANRTSFSRRFIADVANQIGIPTHRINILSIVAGSAVVVWEVVPSGLVVGGKFRPVAEQPKDILMYGTFRRVLFCAFWSQWASCSISSKTRADMRNS